MDHFDVQDLAYSTRQFGLARAAASNDHYPLHEVTLLHVRVCEGRPNYVAELLLIRVGAPSSDPGTIELFSQQR